MFDNSQPNGDVTVTDDGVPVSIFLIPHGSIIKSPVFRGIQARYDAAARASSARRV